MMTRFLELKKPIKLFLLQKPSIPSSALLTGILVDVLKPLAVATETVQHHYYWPISIVLPLYKVILQKLTKEPDGMGPVKDVIRKNPIR